MAVKSERHFQVNSTTEYNQDSSKITELENGNIVVTWRGDDFDSDSYDYYNIYAQIFDNNGNKIGGEFQVNSNLGNNQFSPDITSLTNGNFIIVWNNSNGIYAQIIDESGNKAGDEFQVHYSGYNSEVTTLENGNIVVSWDRKDIYAKIFDSSGNEISGATPVTLNSSEIPTIEENIITSDLNDGETITAGSGADIFNIISGDSASYNIANFNDAGSDKIDLSNISSINQNLTNSSDIEINQIGADTQIIINSANIIINLLDYNKDNLSGDNFIINDENLIISDDNKINELYGDIFNNIIYGKTAGDLIYGNKGDDLIFGENGTDHLFGEAGNDNLNGGNGDDILNGGFGADILIGGRGDDSFDFSSLEDSTIDETDLIEDFEQGKDVINVSEISDLSFDNFEIIIENGFTKIKDHNSDFVIDLNGEFNLHESDFIFA